MTTKFELSDAQLKRFEIWQKNHQQPNGYATTMTSAALSGKTCESPATFSFTQTGIGLAVRVQCGCGSSYDLSEYEKW